MPTHIGTVWSETFAPVPWSFFTRPNADSHRQGPTAGSDKRQTKIKPTKDKRTTKKENLAIYVPDKTIGNKEGLD
jgi:hypothetical protein